MSKQGFPKQRLNFLYIDKSLVKRDPIKIALISTSNIVLTWFVILTILFIANNYGSLLINLSFILILGGAQHRLFTIYHEAFHNNLFTNQRINDFCGMIFASFPSFSTYKSAKKRHIDHHIKTATTFDPERVSHVRTKTEFFKLIFPQFMLLKKLLFRLGFNFQYKEIKGRGDGSLEMGKKYSEILFFIIFHTCFFVVLNWSFPKSFWLYYISVFSVLPIFSMIRSWVEHFNDDQKNIPPYRVMIYSNFVENFFFAPMSFNLHLIHHANMSIPYFKLKKIAKTYSVELKKVQLERKSYLGTFGKHFIKQ